VKKIILAAAAAATVVAPAASANAATNTAKTTSKAVHLCLTRIKHPKKNGPRFTFDIAKTCHPSQRAMTVHLLIGPRGPIGVIGPPGLQGVQGIQRLLRPMGPAGTTGPKGDTGATGNIGPQGPAGPNGSNGTDGTNGTNGTNGTPSSSMYVQAPNRYPVLYLSGLDTYIPGLILPSAVSYSITTVAGDKSLDINGLVNVTVNNSPSNTYVELQVLVDGHVAGVGFVDVPNGTGSSSPVSVPVSALASVSPGTHAVGLAMASDQPGVQMVGGGITVIATG
jgi:hypothetical protein